MSAQMTCPVCGTTVPLSPGEQVPSHVGRTPGRLCASSGWCTTRGHDGRPALPRAFFPARRP